MRKVVHELRGTGRAALGDQAWPVDYALDVLQEAVENYGANAPYKATGSYWIEGTIRAHFRLNRDPLPTSERLILTTQEGYNLDFSFSSKVGTIVARGQLRGENDEPVVFR